MAVHEAGHAVASLCMGVPSISMITIRAAHGNAYMTASLGGPGLMTEQHLMGRVVILLAGRAAKERYSRALTSASGGAPNSDLAQATQLALDMEMRLGFGENPLVYRHVADPYSLLAADADLRERVSGRLDQAYDIARTIVADNPRAIDFLMEMLLEHETLQGEELADTLGKVKYFMEIAKDEKAQEMRAGDKPGWVTKD